MGSTNNSFLRESSDSDSDSDSPSLPPPSLLLLSSQQSQDSLEFRRFFEYVPLVTISNLHILHPASSHLWRSLLAQHSMAPSNNLIPHPQPFESSLDTRRSERDAHLQLAADARAREREAQRNLMDVQRETLRAAERTISLLREQIRLHDERARLSMASLVPSPAPANTPARTPTQRAALERSLSVRIANLQADIERERRRAGLSGPMRRPETEAAVRARASNSLPNTACPQLVTSPNPRQTVAYRNSPTHRLTSLDAHASTSCLPTPSLLEREWDRQLANHEVDADGVDLVQINSLGDDGHDSKPTTRSRVGHRHVEGLGIHFDVEPEFQGEWSKTRPYPSTTIPRWPACLR